MQPRKTIGGLILIGSALAVLFFPVQTLEVRSRHTGRVLYRTPAAPGDGFTFTYIHSIEKIPVEGVFAVEEDGALRVVETRFPSYGAGLPVQTAGVRPAGAWMVAPSGERLSEFSFFISPVNQASLRIGTRSLDLTQLVEPGDVVAVAVRRHPYILMRLGA